MTSCILTVIKNEHEYLDEWIKYHLDLGVNHIFIFEDIDSESHKEICDKYGDMVSLYSVTAVLDEDEKKRAKEFKLTKKRNPQEIYFPKALTWIKNKCEYDWCFVIDIDEYITFDDKYSNINAVMKEFNGYDAVLLEWKNYGANGLVYKPNYQEKGIIDTYTKIGGFQKSDNKSWYQKVKTAYNMNNYNNTFRSDHLPKSDCKWCKTDFSQNKEVMIYDKIYLRHYITKSFEEYVTKLKIRGMFHPKHRGYDSFFDMNQDMIDKKEKLIQLANEIVEKHNEKNS
jgi:hypothetical protein